MPPRPPIAATARVNLSLVASDEVGGHQAAMIFYLGCAGWAPATVSELSTVASSIRSSFNTRFSALITGVWSLITTTLTMVDGSETQGTDSTVVTGSEAGNTLPPNVAACLSWKINRAYRGGHPRNYLPGLSESQLTGFGSNVMTTAAATALATAANAFMTDINALSSGGDPITMGVVSYVLNKAERVTPVFYPYAGAKVNTRLASQRRRLGKLSVGVYEV